jgi:hypothetical protein
MIVPTLDQFAKIVAFLEARKERARLFYRFRLGKSQFSGVKQSRSKYQRHQGSAECQRRMAKRYVQKSNEEQEVSL